MQDLHLAAPIDRWDEAIPLGNGLMGGLLWGGDAEGGGRKSAGAVLRLSLDRGDLWDLRTPTTFQRPDWNWQTMKAMVARRDAKGLIELFEAPYSDEAYPTKIPAGRIEIDLGRGAHVESFRLDLKRAVGEAVLDGGRAEVFFSAVEPVALMRVTGAEPRVRLVPPPFGQKVDAEAARGISAGLLARLNYPPPTRGRSGDAVWSHQVGAQGFEYAQVVATRRAGRATLIAVAVTCTNDGPDPVAIGRERVAAALDRGWQRMLAPHVKWWRAFWGRSRVRVPDPAVQQHYELVRYFYGAASRRGAPPMPLQGVWTADDGQLPPWKGDYHHDLNTQLCYWPYLVADHLEEGASFLDFMWSLLPEHRRFARDFYGTPGAAVPSVMTLDGKAMGGWHMYTFAVPNGAWIAQAFHLHWRYTMDRAFLAERAYPYCAAIGENQEALLEPDPKTGKLKLPLSSSPEIHDNRLDAWLTPNSNYDLSLMRWLFGALAEMATELGETAAAERWSGLLARLDDLAVDAHDPWGGGGTGSLSVAPGESLTESHRHFSHLMAIHPLGILHAEGSDRDREVIHASFMLLDKLGTGFWCGYSFSWIAAMAARAGQAERARNMLELYLKAFISRNGFHLNGDYRNQGLSLFKYRPFTLEGNFAAAQAVHEMLLQSWGGVVRVFPAVPDTWRDASFDRLRAEGAWRASAERRGGRTVYVAVTAERDGLLRMRDPFGGAKAPWSRRGVKRAGGNYEVALRAGETLEGRL